MSAPWLVQVPLNDNPLVVAEQAIAPPGERVPLIARVLDAGPLSWPWKLMTTAAVSLAVRGELAVAVVTDGVPAAYPTTVELGPGTELFFATRVNVTGGPFAETDKVAVNADPTDCGRPS